MEPVLGRGYSNNEESALTDFYSPPSSIVGEDEDIFYAEEEEEEEDVDDDDDEEIDLNRNTTLSTSSVDETTETNSKGDLKRLLSAQATPPPTPLIARQLLDPIHSATSAFQNLGLNSQLPIAPSKSADLTSTNWSLKSPLFSSKSTTNLLTPTSMDRYLIDQCRPSESVYKPPASTQSFQPQETSRLYSYLNPIEDIPANPWSEPRSPYTPSFVPQRITSNEFIPRRYQSEDPWFLSELSNILRQNTNISLSTRAQQILAANSTNNNRPLRSEKIDNEVINHLIREANWKRQCGMKKEVCVFCRNNGENELIYSSHSLKDSFGNVTCPILRAYQCPICGATGSQAHTIKYCQATGEENNRHVPTPYEKMLRLQTFDFDEHLSPTIPAMFSQMSTSPSSFYTNGWSNSYL